MLGTIAVESEPDSDNMPLSRGTTTAKKKQDKVVLETNLYELARKERIEQNDNEMRKLGIMNLKNSINVAVRQKKKNKETEDYSPQLGTSSESSDEQ